MVEFDSECYECMIQFWLFRLHAYYSHNTVYTAIYNIYYENDNSFLC